MSCKHCCKWFVQEKFDSQEEGAAFTKHKRKMQDARFPDKIKKEKKRNNLKQPSEMDGATEKLNVQQEM